MPVAQVRQKAELLGSYYVKPQRSLDAVAADPLTSLPACGYLNSLVVSDSETAPFLLRAVQGKCFQSPWHEGSSARRTAGPCRDSDCTQSLHVWRAGAGAFRRQVVPIPDPQKFCQAWAASPASMRSLASMNPVHSDFWSRPGSCHSHGTVTSSFPCPSEPTCGHLSFRTL